MGEETKEMGEMNRRVSKGWGLGLEGGAAGGRR